MQNEKCRMQNYMTPQTILILPGWQDSGPDHWQSRWLKKYPNAVKVVQKDWVFAKKDEWVATLNEYIDKHGGDDIILVGHSLACATIAHWAQKYPSKASRIKGALLVSSSDTEVTDFPKEITDFSPMPLQNLNFKTTVVASEDDPYVIMDRAEYFAKCWGAQLVNIGAHGHINTDAGFGEWPEGEKLLQEFIS